MKITEKLVLALATTGLAPPLAVSAESLAAPSGTTAANKYMNEQYSDNFRAWEAKNQVSNISQFSDIKPTDWAYQALSSIVAKHGCLAGYPDGSFKGGNAISRYEAAALINSCLDRISELTDDLKLLTNEFKLELQTFHGRVDRLSTKASMLEAQQFSTTTKLKGEAVMFLGGIPNYTYNQAKAGNTTFNYDLRLNFDTSYTGQDLLRARLRSGNFSSNPFANKTQPFALDLAVPYNSTVKVDRLYYTFPIGKSNSIKLTVAAIARNTELAWLPSAITSHLLDTYNVGTTGVYNKAMGPGLGFQWVQNVAKGKPYFIANTNFIVESGGDSSKGLFNSSGAQNVIAQVGYKSNNWGAALGYRYGSQGTITRNGNGVAGLALADGQYSNSFAVNAYWQPNKTGWFPSISAGYGYNFVNGGTTGSATATNTSKSWILGFQWDDAFAKSNAAGIILGQPAYASGASQSNPWLMECFYKIQATDNISITPTFFYGSGIANASANSATGTTFTGLGGVVQTVFRF